MVTTSIFSTELIKTWTIDGRRLYLVWMDFGMRGDYPFRGSRVSCNGWGWIIAQRPVVVKIYGSSGHFREIQLSFCPGSSAVCGNGFYFNWLNDRCFFVFLRKIAICNFWLNSMSYKVYEKKTAVINCFFYLKSVCTANWCHDPREPPWLKNQQMITPAHQLK